MYRFIQNIGDYFNPGYFTDDFKDSVFKESGFDTDSLKELNKRFSDLRHQYYDVFKKDVIDGNLPMKYVLRKMHDFHSRLLQMLGFNASEPYGQWLYLDVDRVVPVRHIYRNGTQPQLLVLEMQPMIEMGDQQVEGLFEQCYEDESGTAQRYRYSNWQKVTTLPIPEGCKISPKIINQAIEEIFYLPDEQRPRYVMVLAGSRVYLLEEKMFKRGSYLVFDIEELISEAAVSATRDYYTLFYLLCGREALANESQTALMDKLGEASTRNAYAVTKDLKEGVITAVEGLANEAIQYIHEVLGREQDETNEQFAQNVKDDCITIVYRLLFIFYAEARPELSILPMNDEVYVNGYSLDKLRDLETVQMQNQSTKDGYFIHDSLWRLFQMIHTGYNQEATHKTFVVKRIDSPLFDDSKLKALQGIKYRNAVWQKIIYALSISKPDGKRQPGRISYINLGINQLGSVYESLLAYRGFYAEQDYIEVFKAGAEKDGTFLVPASRMDDFEHDEIKWDDNGEAHTYKKGTFVYRLNGRDRQKSASYYTPEVLTQSTVKYTLKGFVDRLKDPEDSFRATDLLNLKILEPAMGAAAFQNEVINQLAELYIIRREEELGKHVPPMERRNEIQKVKAYIATHNVYGVDLNPTAIELGKLSLWLNVIHKDMETPFFSNRLALGNAVIGAWLKVYDKDDVAGIPDRTSKKNKLLPRAWWEKAPHKIRFFKNRVNRSVNEVYHFLLPDKAMLAVRNIAEQKKAHPEETTRMNQLIKNWTGPITDRDFNIMKRLSGKIDLLLKEYFQFQQSVDSLTQNKGNIWGVAGTPSLNLDTYAEKERLNDVRYRHDNAYFRLKMVMDYWCALWFWEYDRTADLPTREEYWNDIEAMLNVSDQELDASTTRALLGARASEPANAATGGRASEPANAATGGRASEPDNTRLATVGLGGPTSYRLSFMERDKYIHITNNILPHWHQRGKVQFVTFRLADSLPQAKLEDLTAYKELWLQQHPKPWDSKTKELYNHEIRNKVDKWLDQGHGSCLLAREDIRQIVIDSLLYYHEKKYVLWHFVIMPNHVHLLLTPIGDANVEEVLSSVKRFTANAINKALKRKGELWQASVFDRMVRDERNFEQYVNYINNNPSCLPANSYSLGAWASEPTNSPEGALGAWVSESTNSPEGALGAWVSESTNSPEGALGAWASEPTNSPKSAVGLGGPTSYGVQEEARPYNTDADSEIIQLSKEQVLAETKGFTDNFLHDSQRYKIVMEYAARYHFFHPMLEFLEVFWLRDGFDIICANPPWIKLEFDEVGIISEKYPEVAIRKMSAPDVRRKRDELFDSNPDLEKLYRSEEMEDAGAAAFLNAPSIYPLLQGQQTNLYKCILTNGMDMINEMGFMGLLTPESIYFEANGQPLRRELFKRLRYHFQYQNELRLFPEVHHHTKYGDQLLGSSRSSSPNFISINNLYHPNTVDACFTHDGNGICGGIKTTDGQWNTNAHKERIVRIGEEELRILSDVFENGADWQSVKLTSIQSEVVISVLKKFSMFPKHVKDFHPIIDDCWHETGAVDAGIIKRETYVPDIEKYEPVVNGPQFFVLNPCYKTPRERCILNSDYDNIDLTTMSEDYIARSNYRPILPLAEYKTIIKGFIVGQDADGKPIYDNWMDHYKVAFREMVGSTSERTLTCAVLPRRTAHVHAVISVAFRDGDDCVDMAALCSSIVMDFYVKTLAVQHVTTSRIEQFPLGVASKYQSALRARTLMLNCLTKHYADLWSECWRDDFRDQTWSIDDPRLKPFGPVGGRASEPDSSGKDNSKIGTVGLGGPTSYGLQKEWSWETPLRNYFERRQALVEIDVIAAMALGLSLQDLEMIYTIQFPVLQQNENDTWYDRKGNIVFTCSKGLTGVGVDRPVWEQIRNMKEGETYAHTIEKSELYRGQHVTYYAPFTRQDRIADYRTAWAHFEKVFDNQKEERN